MKRGWIPYDTEPAVDRACELVELLGAGEVIGGYVAMWTTPTRRPAPHQAWMPTGPTAFSGIDYPKGADGATILERLRFAVWRTTMIIVPSFRTGSGA